MRPLSVRSPPEGGAILTGIRRAATLGGVEPRARVEASDRDTLKWACRQAIPCGVLLPGRRFWGRSFHVDLRETGPRPRLAIAQPTDLATDSVRTLRAGDSVRLWSVRDGEPWHHDGFVASVAVVEGRDAGPVEAAILSLPYRLLKTDRRLTSDALPPARIAVAPVGPEGTGASLTLCEGWLAPGGGTRTRGDGHLLELSRRTFAFSVPLRSPIFFLPGSEVEVGVELNDLGLTTRVEGRVRAVMEWSEHVLYGVELGSPVGGHSVDEHRECLRRAAERAR